MREAFKVATDRDKGRCDRVNTSATVIVMQYLYTRTRDGVVELVERQQQEGFLMSQNQRV